MNDNRNTVPSFGSCRDTAYIDTERILDSCRDKDCYEDVPVYLLEPSCEAIVPGANVRTDKAEVVAASINVDPVPFNRGFYQIGMRVFIRVKCEVCSPAGRPQSVDGLCFVDKKVILYGSEGNVSIFKSRPGVQDFCGTQNIELAGTNLPTAVLETVDPVVLGTKVVGAGGCSMLEFPNSISGIGGERLMCGRNNAMIVVSLGVFSVVRMERPAQYLVNGSEYTVPEKECVSPTTDDPCKLFNRMAFPVGQFYPPSLSEMASQQGGMNQTSCGRGGPHPTGQNGFVKK